MVFFKYNPFSGRMSQTTQETAYRPQGVTEGQAEKGSTGFQFDSKTTKAATVSTAPVREGRKAGQPIPVPIRQTDPSKMLGKIPRDSGYQRIMEMQRLMTRNDGLLVWMKRGPRDMLPYYLSMGLCVIGVGMALKSLVEMSLPKKPE